MVLGYYFHMWCGTMRRRKTCRKMMKRRMAQGLKGRKRDARDMLFKDNMASCREWRKLIGKKLYNEYAMEETISMIPSKDKEDILLCEDN